MPASPLLIGRYALYADIARGGMATVHLGRLCGVAGFTRTVAIKRLHPQYARDPEFVAMFIDEARVASRVRHSHVVSVIDMVALEGELLLVMDYVRGVSLSKLLASRSGEKRVDPRIAVKIACDTLSGLQAAHETRDEQGEPLGIVHRDISPQNILVDSDGNAHVIDFGVAKALGRVQDTRDGQIKGKLSYMAPEQIRQFKVDRLADVYAVGVVLWEMLAGRRLYHAQEDAAVVYQILEGRHPALREFVPGLPPALEAAVNKALAVDPSQRFANASEMAEELERVVPPAAEREVARWVASTAPGALERQASLMNEIEGSEPFCGPLPASVPPGPSDSTDSVLRSANSASFQLDTTSAIHTDARPRSRRRGLQTGLVATVVLVVASIAVWTFSRHGQEASPSAEGDVSASRSEAVWTPPVASSPSEGPGAAIAAVPVVDAGPSASTSASVSLPAGGTIPPVPASPPGKKKKDYGF
jgi:serine/threonine-protein kinase